MPESKTSKYQFYQFDTEKAPNMASFVIYGLLKDQLSPEEKDEIFKKISVFYVMKTQAGTGFDDVYGRGIARIAESGDLDRYYTAVNGPRYAMTSSEEFYKRPTDQMDPALKVFKEGMTELADVMKKKRSNIHFSSEAEKNYYDLMLLMMEDMAKERGWRDNIESDISYEYAWNTEIKFRFTAANPFLNFEIDENHPVFKVLLNEMDDKMALSLVGETGIPDATAGGIRTMKKLEEHIKTADIGRDELIREYEAQQVRMEKALNISRETFAKLEKAHVVENKLEEFTNGSRAYGYVLDDVIAKKDLLKAGWPAADIQNLAMVRRLIGHLDSRNSTEPSRYQEEYDLIMRNMNEEAQKQPQTDAEKEAKEQRQRELEAKKALLEAQKPQIDAAPGLTAELKQLWNELIDGKGMTEADRNARLTKLNGFLNKAKDNIEFAEAKFIQNRVSGMIQRELEPSEKALLSENISGYVKSIEAVDPTLVSSSKQFSNFKTALKELERLKRNLDVNNPEKVNEYKEKVKKAAEKATVYLRYKTYQNKGPNKEKHKRSELEKKRINTVDAILNGLKSLTVPGTDELIIPENNNYRVFDASDSKGILGEYTDSPKTNVYDKLMERYTGRGVVNGTSDKMKKAFAKALTGYLLKKENPKAPFDKKKAKKVFEAINRELRVKEMTDEQLREALQSPDKLPEAIVKQRANVYAPESEAEYTALIKSMKSLYHIITSKDKETPLYNKVFDCVRKLAHLPETLDGIDKDKAFRIVEKNGQEIVRYSRERMIKIPGIYIDQNFRNIYLILHSFYDHCPGMKGLVNDLVYEYNTNRGAEKTRDGRFYISDMAYFDFDHYDSERQDNILSAINENSRPLRAGYSRKLKQEMFDAVKPFDQNEVRNKLKNDKAQAKDNDAPVKGKKLEKTEVRPRRNSMG
ncbi:hypothetical protein SAMN04487934_10938 [Eubacterium ruminantium]|nr:hypothetical protein SAMN04487934_10938 [Eubacterium ruminantium]